MLLSVEVLNLLLYCLQQLGIMLCVGAATIALVTFIVTTRDGKVEPTEENFARAVRKAIWVGLSTVVVSGILITVIHESSGQSSIVGEPVFLFKWILIVALVGAYALLRRKIFSHFLIEGILGGTWCSLFLIHILAPLTTWSTLITLYVILTLAFVASWSLAVTLSRARFSAIKPVTASSSGPKPVVAQVSKKVEPVAPKAPIVVAPPKAVPPQPPPPAPRPIVVATPPQPMPVVASKPLPPVPPPVVVKTPEPPPLSIVPVQTVPLEHHSPWLPAIHIMPKTQKELERGAHIITIANKPKTT